MGTLRTSTLCLVMAVTLGVGHGGRSAALAADAALTNADVINLVNAGFGDEFIVTAIRKAPACSFDLAPQALVAMKAAGVSETILSAMMEISGQPTAKAAETAGEKGPEPAPARARPGAIQIIHSGVGCIVADQYPVFEARFEPSGRVREARLRFRPSGGRHWYSVRMEQRAESYTGVLPKPKPSLDRVDYYIEVMGDGLDSSRTEEYSPAVAAGLAACQGEKIAAMMASAAVVVVAPVGAPLVPAGFSSAGMMAAGGTTATGGAASTGGGAAGSGAGTAGTAAGAAGTGAASAGISSTVLIVGGVAAAGAVGVAVAAGGGDSASDSEPPSYSSTPTTTVPSSPRTQTVAVYVSRQWTSTGIQLTAGQRVAVSATGSVRSGGTSGIGPNGITRWSDGSPCQLSPDAPVQSANCMALVGRVGNGPAFLVGARTDFTANASGPLSLGCNDVYVADNSGSWSATISY